jgi:uncharacterized protein
MEVKTVTPPAGRPTVQSYGPEGFTISGAVYKTAVLIFADGVVEWQLAMPIGVGAFAKAIERRGDFDLLLIGYGDRQDDVPQDLASRLRAEGVPSELMGTGAACRTYNLLAAEGRRVAAALLPAGGH